MIADRVCLQVLSKSAVVSLTFAVCLEVLCCTKADVKSKKDRYSRVYYGRNCLESV